MKRTIAALIAGLVLGTAGTAAGAASLYWSKGGTGYNCEGISSGVSCKAGLYEVGITRDYVYVQKRRTKETFGCRKYDSWAGCVSD